MRKSPAPASRACGSRCWPRTSASPRAASIAASATARRCSRPCWQSWSSGRIAAIEKHTSLDGATARERLKALIALYSERMNTEGMSIELAIRQWARSDELAANAVASVDAARLKNVGHLYRATGLQAEEADAQAFLFYCFVFGQSLLFLERGPRKRAQLVAKSAEKLLRGSGLGAAEVSGRARLPVRRTPFSFLVHSL